MKYLVLATCSIDTSGKRKKKTICDAVQTQDLVLVLVKLGIIKYPYGGNSVCYSLHVVVIIYGVISCCNILLNVGVFLQ